MAFIKFHAKITGIYAVSWIRPSSFTDGAELTLCLEPSVPLTRLLGSRPRLETGSSGCLTEDTPKWHLCAPLEEYWSCGSRSNLYRRRETSRPCWVYFRFPPLSPVMQHRMHADFHGAGCKPKVGPFGRAKAPLSPSKTVLRLEHSDVPTADATSIWAETQRADAQHHDRFPSHGAVETSK